MTYEEVLRYDVLRYFLSPFPMLEEILDMHKTISQYGTLIEVLCAKLISKDGQPVFISNEELYSARDSENTNVVTRPAKGGLELVILPEPKASKWQKAAKYDTDGKPLRKKKTK